MPRNFFCCLFLFIVVLSAFGQKDLPTDYLSPQFHKGRRDAARALMPDSSVMAVFAAPQRTFANDVEYLYHQNPDLYYFTGYKEPNAVLLIFKETQTSADGSRYNEAFFVQQRSATREQWTGRRLGVEGVQKNLGIQTVYTGDKFKDFDWKTPAVKTLLFQLPEGMTEDRDAASLFQIVETFKKKAGVPANYDPAFYDDLNRFMNAVKPDNIDRALSYFKRQAEGNEAYSSSPEMKAILAVKDSNDLLKVKQGLQNNPWINNDYYPITAKLREIKTPEEMYMIRKAVEISCAGHNEAMKALRPDMSELEIQGLQEYVHKRYGSEEVGYGSIVGAGENGCILHYMTNAKTKIGNELLLMDVGASYHGYTADVTRTIPAKGRFSPEERIIYQLVYDAQEAAFKTLKDGASWADANKAASDVIANGLLKLGIIKKQEDVRKYYPHGLGHHIGLDVHDRSEYGPLKKDMVITIEPGIYIMPDSDCDKKWWGIGVRIEDDALITQDGYELLSSFAPRSIEGVERMMALGSLVKDYKLPPLKTVQKKPF